MILYPTHEAAVADVVDWCNLWLRGYEGDPLDMAEVAMMSDRQMWFYKAGKTAFLKDTV